MRKIWIVVLLFSCLQLAAQQKPQKSVLDIENNDNYSSFAVLDSAGSTNYRLFFTGEEHHFLNANSKIELKMFKYLHKTAGVRVYLLEFGHSLGYIINKYVQTGDSNLHQLLKSHTFPEYYELFTNLHAFYDSLPENEKFTVVSLDLEREPVYPIKLLESLLPETGIPHDSISIHIDALKALSEYFDGESKKRRADNEFVYNSWSHEDVNHSGDTAYVKLGLNMRLTTELFITNYNNHKEKYETYLGSNFKLFDEEVKNILDFFVFDSYGNPGTYMSGGNAAQQYIYRENYMEANVHRLFTQNPSIKAFGQFGRCHTQRSRDKEECGYYYFNSLATRLNTKKNSPIYGKVFSCPMYYPNSIDFMDANVSINRGLKKLIDGSKKNAVTIYLINSADTTLGSLPQRFNALIINNNEKDENSTDSTGPFVARNSYEYDEKLVILAESGISGYSFSNLNNAVHSNFKSLPQFVGLSLNYGENWGANVSSSFHWFPVIEQKVNDSLSINLSGFRTKLRLGADVLRSNKHDLIILFGGGFERWKLETIEHFNEANRKDVFGNNRTTTYSNPAFILELGIDYRAHINIATIGVFAGYQRDLSNKHWRVNNAAITSSPKQSFTSFTVGASLGINISTF